MESLITANFSLQIMQRCVCVLCSRGPLSIHHGIIRNNPRTGVGVVDLPHSASSLSIPILRDYAHDPFSSLSLSLSFSLSLSLSISRRRFCSPAYQPTTPLFLL